MSVLIVGISHRSAPVSLLERVTVGVGSGSDVLAQLRTAGPVSEAAVLATCNRVEVYTDTDGFHAGVAAVTDLLARLSGVPLEELSPHLYVHWEAQAVLHLFTVAAGLDSMVVGESQILGQLRRSYAAARDGDSAGRELHELFQRALRTGKRAHAETGIDEAGRSLVTVALSHAADAIGPLEGRTALLIGAGSMSALSGATLRRLGIGRVVVANRTLEHAQRLAETLEGEAIGLDAIEDAMAAADVVVSCTGSTGVVVEAAAVERAQKLRDDAPIALLDLALPRDIDPAVRDLSGVTLVDLTSLQEVLEDSEAGADVEAARAIVTEEVGTFLAWQMASRVAPTVVALRSRAEEVVAAELARLETRLPDLDPRSRSELHVTVRRVVDKLLHAPTVRVKELTEAPAGLSYADALHELFGLDRAAPAAVTLTPLVLEEDDDA
ncbi:MAG: glutamyl-tRNA reductase [Actinomycetota bacterium]|jgi:glutamyl-tRNA reductase|nr:glutamyl-tRNA reductase [Actinomycetota bacterium]